MILCVFGRLPGVQLAMQHKEHGYAAFSAEVVSLSQAARALGYKAPGLRNLIRAGAIVATRITPRSPYRIAVTELERLLGRNPQQKRAA